MERFTITELSSNNSDFLFPRIFDDNVVWQADVGGDSEIFLYNGSETIQITDNDVSDNLPQIFGNNIVWQSSFEDDDSEIFLYDGSETIQITDNDVSDSLPQIFDDNVVWQADVGGDSEIFLYNGSQTIQITDNDIDDRFPRIFGNNIVWQSSSEDDDSEIFFYNGSEIVQITDNDIDDRFPQVSENNIAWEGGSDNESEIFFYDGSEIVQITDNNLPDNFSSSTAVSVFYSRNNLVGDNVIWRRESEDNRESFIYNGDETIQITNDGIPNEEVIDSLFSSSTLPNNILVFTVGFGNESEVFVYDDREVIQLTDNDVPDGHLAASNGNIIWARRNTFESEEETYSLFLATPNDIDPLTGATVYRFFNNNTGVHFYTADETERDAVQQLDNYVFEGASYQSIDPLTGDPEPVPVYRFLNQDTGFHLYTTSQTEREAVQELNNFSFEGEAFFAYEMEVDGSIPIYRFFNSASGAHFYTPSAAERDNVEANLSEFQSEGIAYYALPLE